ncbi:hypothetical protein GCM10009868_39340 [Terrabacter aerolatus]|uniref:Uncharacterized protein n=1 Tax=Terrabacter aerolatus TaxID=422442 RepID=A0A512D0E0_9MICO|nr:hypothetical protein TAE01_17430 [Terrabacter aerolatus]
MVLGPVGAAAAPVAGAVDWAERRRGDGREDERVLRHRVGDAFAADDPGPDEVEGVGGVDAGTGGAVGGATVPAADVQDPERSVGRRERGHDLTGAGVDGLRRAVQANRSGAVSDPGGGLGPGVEVPRQQPGQHLRLGGRVEVVQVERVSVPDPIAASLLV